MAEWCATNLKNCAAWKTAGLELSTTCDENAKWLDACIRQLVSWSDCDALGGFQKSLESLVASDTDAISARCFIVGLTGLGTESAGRDQEFVAKMDRLEIDAAKMGTPREKRHARAAILWGKGHHHEAAKVWDSILDDFPNDLMAIKFSHDAHFFNGDCAGKLAAIEKVIKKWDKHDACYSYLHGMYAFGLEESARYDEAEREADVALSLNRYDCWAAHAKAHVLEMCGRHREGRDFMYTTEMEWRRGWMLATHNYWHTALFHIEFCEYEEALAIFDREVANRFNRTNSLLDMVDASSLLWRLELEGVQVGAKRWRKIENLAKYIDNHSIVFNDVHLGLALDRQQNCDVERRLRQSLLDYSDLPNDEDNSKITRTVGLPLYDGMLAYAHGDYDDAVEKMFAIRGDVIRIGGSHAQRDMFAQTLIHSAILARKPENWRRASTLLLEREALKPKSLLGERLATKFRILHSV